MLLTHTGFYHVIMYHHHQHLHHTHKSLGRVTLTIVFLIPSCTTQEYYDKHNYHDPYLTNRLGDTKVKWPFIRTLLINLTMFVMVEIIVAG